MSREIKLPCLKGRMGDWIYYISLLNFKELAQRTSMVTEIHKNEGLSRWIQRKVSQRSEDIIAYLKEQPQRFFNSIIFGIYGGKPKWQELDLDKKIDFLSEEERDYLSKTFGILTLSGDEKIFAIDGQHRTNAIKHCVREMEDLNNEEVAVIFVAHKTTREGEIRTRRLFSTLNRYAVPVNTSEIIALDEEDNCAIITRSLMEDFEFLSDKVKFSKTKSISPQDNSHFTNIVLLYDIIAIILTNKSFSKRVRFQGYDLKKFTTRRESEAVLEKEIKKVRNYLIEVIEAIPSLKKFFKEGNINRNNNRTNLIFRPIGQLIIFFVLKVAEQYNDKQKAIRYFARDTFNLSNENWNKIFFDQQSQTLKTDKPRQNLAIQVILKSLGIDVPATKKEKEFLENLNINFDEI